MTDTKTDDERITNTPITLGVGMAILYVRDAAAAEVRDLLASLDPAHSTQMSAMRLPRKATIWTSGM